jgi:hypothetical protein
VQGYVSQDGFIYFRAWLIGQGRETFEKVVADVETLADILPPDIEMSPEGEELLSTGADAYEAATGEELIDCAGGYNDGGVHDDIDVPDTEDTGFLKTRYPRLTRHLVSWRREF